MASNSISVVSLPKTSSRCISESFTATHDFEVTNYPELDGMGVGEFVSSSTFSVAGYDWKIDFYPDGCWEDSTGFASAFLYCVSELAEDVKTKFTLNMLVNEGKARLLVTSLAFSKFEHVFSPEGTVWGWSQFVQKSKLKSSTNVKGCYLIIRCILTVTKEPRTVAKRNLVVVPQPNLQDHLRHMWKDGQGADVTFIVRGQLFHAHGCLLAARSPVFKAELFGPMKVKATQSINVVDIEPLVFEALLHFVYTDSMPDDEHSKDGRTAKLQHLLVAADRYGLDRLRVLCESKLCESIDVETVATTLVLAEQHHCKDLKEACVEFIAAWNVLPTVMATDGFKHLVASCPLLMKEILDKVSCSD
ncbi:BTB/POZ and MATH domain-containing protein 2-like [Triticum urartu]|nr:BTB/POZ and MATH domain-containing protein 2-like [Triticum urartu]